MKTPMTKLMLAAVAATLLCLGARAATIDLSTLTEDFTAQDGYVLTGELGGNFKVSIADGATVQIKDVTINGVNDVAYPWAGITCEGDAWLVIEGSNVVKSFYGDYPGVYVPPGDPPGDTLTISGTGTLVAHSQGNGAGIGGRPWYQTCGNIVIDSGTIIAYAGGYAAGIGGGQYGNCGNITINGGIVTAYGGELSAAIGAAVSGTCGDITINGGEVHAYAKDWVGNGTGIGSCYDKTCGVITIGENITKVEVTKSGGVGWHIGGGTVTIPSEENLKRTYSSDGNTLTLEPDYKWDITWLSDEGELIEVTIVNGGAIPVYPDQEKSATAPYRYVFAGWTPELEAAVSNTAYTATFKKIADTSLLTEDWQAANGDAIVVTNATAHSVTIPAGASVTINGVTIKGASGGGGVVDAPSFSESGESAVTKFEGAGNTWTLTAFAEMEGDSVGTAVTDEQIKVYAADTVEGLESASPMTSGVVVEERKSAVKAKLIVTPPDPTAPAQFFKVKFGE